MTPDLKKLYQQTLLAHSKQPHNNRAIDNAPSQTLRNPLCGDEITVYQKSNDNGSIETTFTAQACSICLASASMMTQHLAAIPALEARIFAQQFVSNFKDNPEALELHGDLAALAGVQAFPSRIRCATLPWEAYLKLTEQPENQTAK